MSLSGSRKRKFDDNELNLSKIFKTKEIKNNKSDENEVELMKLLKKIKEIKKLKDGDINNDNQLDLHRILKTAKEITCHEVDDDIVDVDDDFSFAGSGDSVTMHENHIYFRSRVSKTSVMKLTRLLTLANDKFDKIEKLHNILEIVPKPIVLHITSEGGDLLYSFLAFDAIKRSKIPVHAVAEGYVASAGTVMLVAAGKRYGTPNSVLMVHQLSSGGAGTFEQLTDQHQNYSLFMKKMKDMYLENTKIKQKELDALMKRDVFLDVNTCIKYGFFHEVYSDEH